MPLTVEDIRLSLLDRSPSDNPLDMDLSFSDDDIKDAMKRACMAFNEFPPYVVVFADPSKIPQKGFMIDGTIKYLYLSALSRLQRNRVKYEAGNMSADPDAERAKYFAEMIARHGKEFESAARNHKIEVNLHLAYGHY